MKECFVIGLMSGTSLDGLDLAYCSFSFKKSWSYKILTFKTINYTPSFKDRLRNAPHLKATLLSDLSIEFGSFMAECIAKFIHENSISQIDLIASHGHTVFHEPENGITLQIGNPKPIYDLLNIPVAYDFRIQDVSLGGQGAPLVPFVDQLLFSEYDACLNLGGFSNISFDDRGVRVAFDICPVNIVLNLWANKLGFNFDDKGMLASSGEIHLPLLEQLNNLDFYSKTLPKSLGWEWVLAHVLPILELDKLSEVDVLRTFTEHIAVQIAEVLNSNKLKTVLITGGGSYNTFLCSRLASLSPNTELKMDQSLIESKEAMAFAFLGLMKLKNTVNVWSSVTGSVKDHSSGKIYPEEL